MSIKHFPFEGPPKFGNPKFTQIGIFGMKVYHLATLVMIAICSRLAVPACAFGFLENNNIRVWASGQCYKMASLRQ
jgi:hypothetical protein